MSIINFSTTNCQNCYACVRVCAVHAVRVRNGQAEIDEDKCIACGKCLDVCPKNAKKIHSELFIVDNLIKNNQTIALSLAPSFVSLFEESPQKICSLLKTIGFTYVEETVIGAELVTNLYKKIHEEEEGTHISSCCPSVNLLIEKYYPDLIPHLLPVISPMVCHARLIKRNYGEHVKVVFAGPCLSKKLEGLNEDSIDAVLTFNELKQLIDERKRSIKDVIEIPIETGNSSYINYPIEGGIATHFDQPVIQVTGIDDCIATLESVRKGQLQNLFIEMSACRHSCINGSAMPKDGVSVHERKLRILNYAKNKIVLKKTIQYDIDLRRTFTNLATPLEIPNDNVLTSILKSMGKHSKEDELNCTYCGYPSCKDKAIAIYNGMAEPDMCLPFMKQRAETLTNIVFDVTPSIALMVNRDLDIVEFNPAAEKFFNIMKEKAIGLPISAFLDENIFKYVKQHKCDLLDKKVSFTHNDTKIFQSILWLESHEVMLCIIHDLTEDLRKQYWIKNLQLNAVDMAQEVINKQMRVAQEIASLLGETTAETKVTLTRLKKLINETEDDDHEILR